MARMGRIYTFNIVDGWFRNANVALWVIWEKCGLNQRELGELFGGINYPAVAQRLRRIKPKSRETAEKLIKQMSNV